MKKRLKEDKKGIAGFFLDGPVLLVVILIITVFIAMVSQSFLDYRREIQRAELDEMCLDLKREIQEHPEIVKEEKNRLMTGQFSTEKLNDLDHETLLEHLSFDTNYFFSVTINDTESEDRWVFGNTYENDRSYVSSYTGPVLLVDGTADIRIGELGVKVWEM